MDGHEFGWFPDPQNKIAWLGIQDSGNEVQWCPNTSLLSNTYCVPGVSCPLNKCSLSCKSGTKY